MDIKRGIPFYRAIHYRYTSSWNQSAGLEWLCVLITPRRLPFPSEKFGSALKTLKVIDISEDNLPRIVWPKAETSDGSELRQG